MINKLTTEQRKFLQKVLDSGLLNQLPYKQLPDFERGSDITELIETDFWFQTDVIHTIHQALSTGMYEKKRHLNVVGIMWKHRKEIFKT